MLTHIYVKDLAIVSTLELELSGGMTALTGETGAGKSILIDALGLTLGDKADNSMIRAGCDRAEVSASFDASGLPAVQAWLEENGLEEEGQCLVRRQLVRDGRSRCYVNGRPVPLQQAQELGTRLVDIHGQHAHQSLLRPTEQRRLLDRYAAAEKTTERVAGLYRHWREARSRLQALQSAARDRSSRLELLSYQRDELQALAVTPEELAELDAEQRRLRNVGRLQETAGGLLHRLYEDEYAIQSQLDRALGDLDELLDYDPDLGEVRELVEGAAIQIREAASGLRHFTDGLELDPGRLEQVELRLEAIHDAARKHRVPAQDLPARLEEIRSELAGLEHADLELDRLHREVGERRRRFLDLATDLGARRRAAGQRLSAAVSASMQTLGMDGGRFEAAVQPQEEEQAGAYGLETVGFLVSANPGQPLRPLAKVASGGELSRISLGIQVATAECGEVPTLIFDEVDVGIGGGVAEIVGRLLRRLGDSRQVLCVTHLPQVAAQAHRQLQVKKYSRDGTTYTGVAPLGEDQRVEEIARMLGGVAITDTTLEHAREMLAGVDGA
jgi:DNA repair protein RecN (Recombination protein N)